MSLWNRAPRPPALVVAAAGLARGERVLASAQAGERWLIGTRRALVVVEPGADPVRLPWETVQAADWDRDTSTLTVSDVGEFGRPRVRLEFSLEDPALLLQLVRERVTASVVLQRGFLTGAKKGFKVIGRRAPEGGPVHWMHEYDEGVDPADPDVAAAATAALAQARADVGEQ